MKKLTAKLDAIAGSLEAKGLLKEAEILDTVSNTLEATDTYKDIPLNPEHIEALKKDNRDLLQAGEFRNISKVWAQQNPNGGIDVVFDTTSPSFIEGKKLKHMVNQWTIDGMGVSSISITYDREDFDNAINEIKGTPKG